MKGSEVGDSIHGHDDSRGQKGERSYGHSQERKAQGAEDCSDRIFIADNNLSLFGVLWDKEMYLSRNETVFQAFIAAPDDVEEECEIIEEIVEDSYKPAKFLI